MKRYLGSAFWFSLVVLLVGMTCRSLWLASRTEAGFDTIKQQWGDSTIGLVVGGRTPVYSREPVEQAAFWLGETERVLQAHSNDAELSMGAAIVLDGPGTGFVTNYMKIESFPGLGTFPDLDYERIERAADAFEAQCSERCLDLAARATELDSSNVEWWQLRALLLWRQALYSCDESPRDAEWVKILDQCASHDPSNALYDYLAAHFYWESSAEIEFTDATDVLVIKDADRFNLGVSRFQEGQTKPTFTVGDAGFSAVAKFLGQTRLPLTEHEQIVNSRAIHLRRSVLLRNVWRWQGMRADEAAAAGDLNVALALCARILTLSSNSLAQASQLPTITLHLR